MWHLTHARKEITYLIKKRAFFSHLKIMKIIKLQIITFAEPFHVAGLTTEC